MKLDQINRLKENYKLALQADNAPPDPLLRSCVLEWQAHFDIDEMYLSPIIDRALKNQISGRLWGGEKHSIKSGLIQLSENNPDLFWTALKDLFDEERMIIMKVSRFIHHCDVIFEDVKKKDDKAVTHFQNYESACLLLSLQYPSKYCLFNFDPFERFCSAIGVQEMPVNTDLERYFKIVNVIYKIVSKDDQFMEAYYSRLEGDLYLGPSLEVVYHLIEFNFGI